VLRAWQSAQWQARRNGGGGAVNHRTVVVADGTPALLRLVEAVLSLEPCRLVRAGTGGDALAAIREARPHVALLDLGLPDLDGLEVLRAVRESPELAGTRVVLMAGRADGERACLAAGADAFVPKPFRVAELLAAVRPFLPDDDWRRAQSAGPT
jgi:two-component system KDP operon response regulator KdpE